MVRRGFYQGSDKYINNFLIYYSRGCPWFYAIYSMSDMNTFRLKTLSRRWKLPDPARAGFTELASLKSRNIISALRITLRCWSRSMTIGLQSRSERDFFRPYVRQVIHRFLDCGILHNGFARVRCGDCGHEYLLAFGLERSGNHASAWQTKTILPIPGPDLLSCGNCNGSFQVKQTQIFN